MAARPILVIPISLCFVLCGCAWLDHSSDSGLERDLAAQHMAIARVSYESDGSLGLEIRTPDGRRKAVGLSCCARAGVESFARKRIVLVDLGEAQEPFDPKATGDASSGPVVLMNEEGKQIERSAIRVHASLLSLSPDEKSFAFLGSTETAPTGGAGLYMAGFHDREPQKLASIDPLIALNHQVHPSLDWSSDGRDLLFTDTDGIHLVNLETGKSEKIADGGMARLGPSGQWISYVALHGEAMLLNLQTRETKAIDPGHMVNRPMEWSPDGKYLLVDEGEGSHLPYGCYWVYRVSDSAWLALQDLGVGGLPPNWIQLGSEP
jgi:hypothetical protein